MGPMRRCPTVFKFTSPRSGKGVRTQFQRHASQILLIKDYHLTSIKAKIPLYLCTVSGQNTIGIYITPLVLIQPTDVEQNAVNNNWLLKLQPAVKLQSWQKSNFHQIE